MHAVKLTNSEALFDASYSPEIKVYVDGVLTAPSAATLSLFKPSGTEEVTDRVCTIGPTTKVITATFTTAEREDDAMEDYRLLLKYTIGGIVYQTNFLFDDCMTPLYCSVIDTDLTALAPELASDRWDGQSTFTTQIERAFGDIKRRLKERGRRARLMVDGSQIHDLVVTHALELIFFDFAKSGDDIWWIKYLKQAEKFNSEFENLHLKYDTDEDGVVDDGVIFGTVNLVR